MKICFTCWGNNDTVNITRTYREIFGNICPHTSRSIMSGQSLGIVRHWRVRKRGFVTCETVEGGRREKRLGIYEKERVVE
jgi:hypothetical protein